MRAPQKKGKVLEYAVKRIEEELLRNDPSFAGAEATITPNKIVTVAGVRHEIDLWILLHPGTPHEFIHIMECKNWKKKVGTKEVYALAGKREAVGAAKATLITTGISKDAERLAKEKRVAVALVTDFPGLEIDAPVTSHKIEGGESQVWFREQDAPRTLSNDVECTVEGRKMPLSAVHDAFVAQHLKAVTQRDPRRKLPGTHTGFTSFDYQIKPSMFFISGLEVTRIAAEIHYSVDMYYPEIKARFSVQGRGGFCKLDYPPGAMGVERFSLELFTKASMT